MCDTRRGDQLDALVAVELVAEQTFAGAEQHRYDG